LPANPPTSAPSSPSSNPRSRKAPHGTRSRSGSGATDDAPIDTGEAIKVSALREALREFLRESELIAQASGLTPQRHLLLLMIKGAPDGSEHATVSELAKRLRLAQTTVTDLVSRAEQAGLIEREQSEADARVAILRLTAEGERRLARSFRAHAAERERLRAVLEKLMT